MRLTEKVELFNGVKTYKKLSTISQQELVLKLGQLEDIEEELGIDLITLFKALKNGIWFVYNPKEVYYHKLPSVDYHKQLDRWYIRIDYDIAYELKDYGKTWALTKEELL